METTDRNQFLNTHVIHLPVLSGKGFTKSKAKKVYLIFQLPSFGYAKASSLEKCIFSPGRIVSLL